MKKLLLVVILWMGFNPIFSQVHFISDSAYLKKVETDFAKQKLLASNRNNELFTIFNLPLSLEEKEALLFLYAYMPLSDLADYDGEFFLQQVRIALLARRTFSWGPRVPEDIFRHFVLPYRVNNENLDSARSVFFKELKSRIINLSMREAALEVNHWCHEKVSYKGSDIRTSAPLSTVKTANGRCGEESTFTVTALRAVGIPARQVYTPRWAHCDDNHAWVEVWMDDGKWYYLGACEPESDLNMGWFSAPVLRAMICNTTVFGDYRGKEEVLKKEEKYTQINLIQNYAPAKSVVVRVVDTKNKSVPQASVEFQLYNYAEFYTLAKKTCDANGYAQLSTGYGDLMIWAYHNNQFGFEKITVEKTDTLVIMLTNSAGYKASFSVTLTPPVVRQPITPDAQGKEHNEKRLKAEDSIRNNYQKTFIDSINAIGIASIVQISSDSVWGWLKQSCGNWGEIARFLLKSAPQNKVLTQQLLDNISAKDLRDTPSPILEDAVRYADFYYTQTQKIPVELFWKYVVNPRIANEILSKYISVFQQEFSQEFKNIIRENPSNLVMYVNEQVSVSTTNNYSRTSITPIGTHRLRYADALSRDIYFVAILRSLGIPSRINTATKIPEYYKNDMWNEVYFEKSSVGNTPKGTVIFDYDKSKTDFTPAYYVHFTIAKFSGGTYHSLDYEESTAFTKFPAELSLDTGSYLIITGIRNNDGSVNAHLTFFTLNNKETTTQNLLFHHREIAITPLASFDFAKKYKSLTTENEVPFTQLKTELGMVLAWIDPDKEPTKHTIIDFQQLKNSFEQWGGSIVFLLSEEKKSKTFSSNTFPGLPVQLIYGIDSQDLLSQVETALNIKFNNDFPIFTLINSKGQIMDYSSGYKIGRGEQIIKMLKYLK